MTNPPKPFRLLVLGGSTEASVLAAAIAQDTRFAAVLSLAGRTRSPRPQPVPCRVGGFGGAAGLAAYLREEGVQAVIDATHPFAARMSANAVAAAEAQGARLLRIDRPPWVAGPGDDWRVVGGIAESVAALGDVPRRVLLTVGQQELAPFRAWRVPHRYVVRSIDTPSPDSLPEGAVALTAAGPFTEAEEEKLFREHLIEVLVTKNSGGGATAAKLAVARRLGLPVVMVARPILPPADSVPDAAGAVSRLADFLADR